VPSGEITNLPFIEQLARYGLPMIVSTGMADLDEVRAAVDAVRAVQAKLKNAPQAPALCVLHCTTAYPTADVDVNLAAIETLKNEFDVAVGYSDHTQGIFVSTIAVAMGACIIEKHITLDRSLPGPDHRASIEPNELAQMISDIRRVELLVGDGTKAARPSELEARQLVRKGLKAARPLPAGHVLTASDIAVLRPADGLPPAEFNKAVGARTRTPLGAGAPLTWEVIG
jgi:sialic acid synthase SpsE